MNARLTHASFFSGVGGLDLGLERAGWQTVSFSEIDPYASAVLAERWPGVPNLGDIVQLDLPNESGQDRRDHQRGQGCSDWQRASLWTGGFPCQDLSIAGKRRGMGTEGERTRSGLAYAFLDLVEQHRPPAILLENVPGLLSSNGGKDFGALLGRLGELGYWWAYRILDAQFFGVPQRRRRVFICALHAGAGFGADSPAAVLSVGTRCNGHSAAGDQARTGVALGTGEGVELAGSLTRRYGKGINTTLDDGATVVSPSPNPDRVREADGLAGRSHDRVHPSLRAGGHGSPGIGRDGDEERLVLAHTLTAPNTQAKPIDGKRQDGSRLDRIPVTLAPTLRVGPQRPQDGGPGDTVPIIAATLNSGGTAAIIGGEPADDPLLPLGLDSHRYRCCGNGVVSNVSEWIGERLARAIEEAMEGAA